MPWVEFEPTIPAFEQANTVHVLDRAATVMGPHFHTYILGKFQEYPRYRKTCTTPYSTDRMFVQYARIWGQLLQWNIAVKK
jgi:hypothetical protein